MTVEHMSEEELDRGLGLLNYKVSQIAEKTVPKNWMGGKIGRTLVYFNPDYPEVLNAWERQHKISKGVTTKRNLSFSVGTAAVGPDGKKRPIQAITRLLPPAFPELEAASRNGVRVEKPIAMFFDGRSRPVSVFEHIQGPTLDELISACPATTDENRNKRSAALKSALEELGKLHKLKIYHWDATAKNMILSKDGATLIDVSPGYIVNAIRKTSKQDARLASKPNVFDFSRLYASLHDRLTDEERALFDGKISDEAVKFHIKRLEESRNPEQVLTLRF